MLPWLYPGSSPISSQEAIVLWPHCPHLLITDLHPKDDPICPDVKAALTYLEVECRHEARKEQVWWTGGTYAPAQKLPPKSSCASRCSPKSSLNADVTHHGTLLKYVFFLWPVESKTTCLAGIDLSAPPRVLSAQQVLRECQLTD